MNYFGLEKAPPAKTAESSSFENITIDHYLIDHTIDTADKVAQAIKESGPYNTLYIEMCTDELTQKFHEEIMQKTIDGELAADRARVAERDSHLLIADGLRFTGINVVAIDRNFGDKFKAPIGPSPTPEHMRDVIVKRGLHNRLREPHMAQQVLEDLPRNANSEFRAALVTGAMHTDVSNRLKTAGIKTSRRFIVNNELVTDSTILPNEKIRYAGIIAVQRAIRFDTPDALNHVDEFVAELFGS